MIMIDFKQLMFDKGLNQSDLAQIWGISQSLVSKVVRGERGVPEYYIEKIIEHFGEDVIKKYTLPADAYEPKSRVATVTIINPEIIEEAKELGREEARAETQGDAVVSVPFVDKVIATAPDLDVRDLVREKGHTLEEFPFYKMVKGVDYIQTVITMAMAPRFLPGDYLFIRFRYGQVLSGKIYLVDTRIYGTMLRYVYIEEGGYTLKALNPEFKDVFVKNEDVYSISSVMLSVNTNTSLTSEINLAEMVKSRDAQVATLTTTQSSMLDQQQQLINEIRKQNERMEKYSDRLEEERKRNNALVDKIINKE